MGRGASRPASGHVGRCPGMAGPSCSGPGIRSRPRPRNSLWVQRARANGLGPDGRERHHRGGRVPAWPGGTRREHRSARPAHREGGGDHGGCRCLRQSALSDVLRLAGGGRVDEDWRPALPGWERWFRPDVARDLARLRAAIFALGADRDVTDLLWVCFSSLIVARTSVANARDLVHSRHHYQFREQDPQCMQRFRMRAAGGAADDGRVPRAAARKWRRHPQCGSDRSGRSRGADGGWHRRSGAHLPCTAQRSTTLARTCSRSRG
jgi:hypothetical protein